MDHTAPTIVHIVSFNIPYPPDYGGVMDVFYKITSLKKQGVGVILHCFSYGRSMSKTLERECLKVHYYQRNLNLFLLFRKQPFIVISRENEKLLAALKADNHPIIFEGIHSTAWLGHPQLNGRMTMVRTHNIEHLYYKNLAQSEKNPFRKIFFKAEAQKLERYETRLSEASLLLPISPGDTEYFRNKYGRALFIGPFHQSDKCVSSPGKGNYILMHGDFSTPENNASALFIIREVASKWDYRTVFAGKRPSAELLRAAAFHKNIRMIPNPSQSKMTELILNAQINLLHASQPSGMKLKLINALCFGRHIIASEPVVSGTNLDSLVHIAYKRDQWTELAARLMEIDFTDDIIRKRDILLREVADNQSNAIKIIESINSYNVHP
ncbi:MAG TPA: hypothetical protein VMV74_03585 [Bacteroidales bacterium]|nr:hypothetical protein [Bacteroidales bacterium]